MKKCFPEAREAFTAQKEALVSQTEQQPMTAEAAEQVHRQLLRAKADLFHVLCVLQLIVAFVPCDCRVSCL